MPSYQSPRAQLGDIIVFRLRTSCVQGVVLKASTAFGEGWVYSVEICAEPERQVIDMVCEEDIVEVLYDRVISQSPNHVISRTIDS